MYNKYSTWGDDLGEIQHSALLHAVFCTYSHNASSNNYINDYNTDYALMVAIMYCIYTNFQCFLWSTDHPQNVYP